MNFLTIKGLELNLHKRGESGFLIFWANILYKMLTKYNFLNNKITILSNCLSL